MSSQMRPAAPISRRTALRAGAATGLVLAAGAVGAGKSRAQAQAASLRWDIADLQLQGEVPVSITAGGESSAKAVTGHKITFTGTGTVNPGAGTATGGGNFTVRIPTGAVQETGTYRVTGLVFWEEAGRILSVPASVDHIGNVADLRGGLLIMRVAYADGNNGVLVFSCQLEDTPPPVFEGVTASHGPVFFYNTAGDGSDGVTIIHVQGAPVALPRTGDGTVDEDEATGE